MDHYESFGQGLAGKRKVDLEEGVKHDEGKPDWSLLPPDALEDVIRVYEYGCVKYARDNWRKGITYSRIFRGIIGHLWKWWRGHETNPEDGGVKHLAQAAWGCLTLLEYTRTAKYQLFDNRLIDDGFPVNPEEHCDHQWTFTAWRSASNGTYNTYTCIKCGISREKLQPIVSIPTCWTDAPSVPFTISTSCGDFSKQWYIFDNGEIKEYKGPTPA